MSEYSRWVGETLTYDFTVMMYIIMQKIILLTFTLLSKMYVIDWLTDKRDLIEYTWVGQPNTYVVVDLDDLHYHATFLRPSIFLSFSEYNSK